jgi:hypothetical protein
MLCAADFNVISADNTFDLPARTSTVIDQNDLAFLQGAHRRLAL